MDPGELPPVWSLPILNWLQHNRAYVSSASHGYTRLLLIVQMISEQV